MDLLTIRHKLLNWYYTNKRDLPWRNSKNPYQIWISEVILQQTKIAQGISYYHQFMETYPTVSDLANASEADVLKIWQGLGYYSRARNLHFAAKQIEFDYLKQFPSNFTELKKLKGVGDYTAAAIASIAYNEAVASVDGNVYRVLSRLSALKLNHLETSGKKYYNALANKILDKKHPGDFNQALMELGALVCKPKLPNCLSCPIHNSCLAFGNNTVSEFPKKRKKATVKNRYFHYIVITNQESIILRKREGKDIWRNLFDFPLIENERQLTMAEIVSHIIWKQLLSNREATLIGYSDQYVHILTHQKIHARFIQVHINELQNFPSEFLILNKSNIFDVAVPRLIDKFISDRLT